MKLITIALLVGVTSCSPAFAQNNCGPRDDVVAYLEQNYSEYRVSVALDSYQRMVETYANLETGTWTVLMTAPGALSCIVAHGEHFETVLEAPGEDT